MQCETAPHPHSDRVTACPTVSGGGKIMPADNLLTAGPGIQTPLHFFVCALFFCNIKDFYDDW